MTETIVKGEVFMERDSHLFGKVQVFAPAIASPDRWADGFFMLATETGRMGKEGIEEARESDGIYVAVRPDRLWHAFNHTGLLRWSDLWSDPDAEVEG